MAFNCQIMASTVSVLFKASGQRDGQERKRWVGTASWPVQAEHGHAWWPSFRPEPQELTFLTSLYSYSSCFLNTHSQLLMIYLLSCTALLICFSTYCTIYLNWTQARATNRTFLFAHTHKLFATYFITLAADWRADVRSAKQKHVSFLSPFHDHLSGQAVRNRESQKVRRVKRTRSAVLFGLLAKKKKAKDDTFLLLCLHIHGHSDTLFPHIRVRAAVAFSLSLSLTRSPLPSYFLTVSSTAASIHFCSGCPVVHCAVLSVHCTW